MSAVLEDARDKTVKAQASRKTTKSKVLVSHQVRTARTRSIQAIYPTTVKATTIKVQAKCISPVQGVSFTTILQSTKSELNRGSKRRVSIVSRPFGV